MAPRQATTQQDSSKPTQRGNASFPASTPTPNPRGRPASPSVPGEQHAMLESPFYLGFSSVSVQFLVNPLHFSCSSQVQIYSRYTDVYTDTQPMLQVWRSLGTGNHARMQEIKHLLPAASAPAWQAAWDSPQGTGPGQQRGGCDGGGVPWLCNLLTVQLLEAELHFLSPAARKQPGLTQTRLGSGASFVLWVSSFLCSGQHELRALQPLKALLNSPCTS